jgi:tetratricopeptide (TPR) repeat protein
VTESDARDTPLPRPSIERDPVEERAQRARMLLQAGSPTQALKEAGRALALEPSDPDALMVAGRANAELKHYPDAMRLGRAAVAGRPDDPSLLREFAYLRSECGDTAGAVETASKVAGLLPDDGDSLADLANLLLNDRKPRKALAVAKNALLLVPMSEFAQLTWANAQSQLGHRTEAAPVYHAVLADDPQNFLARHNLTVAARPDVDRLRKLVALANLAGERPDSELLRYNMRIAIGNLVRQSQVVAWAAYIWWFAAQRIFRLPTGPYQDEGAARTLLLGLGLAALLALVIMVGVARRRLGARFGTFARMASRDGLLMIYGALEIVAIGVLLIPRLVPSAPVAVVVDVGIGIMALGTLFALIRWGVLRRRRPSTLEG